MMVTVVKSNFKTCFICKYSCVPNTLILIFKVQKNQLFRPLLDNVVLPLTHRNADTFFSRVLVPNLNIQTLHFGILELIRRLKWINTTQQWVHLPRSSEFVIGNNKSKFSRECHVSLADNSFYTRHEKSQAINLFSSGLPCTFAWIVIFYCAATLKSKNWEKRLM